MIIKTVEELLALRDNDGRIRADSNLVIECDISYVDGQKIGNISADGEIYARGEIYAGGNISADGNIYAGGEIYANGNISASGNISAHGDIYAHGDAVMHGDLIWSHAAPPRIKGRWFHRRILPPAWQRDYWAKRLGVDMTGCYDEIIARLDVDDMLTQDKWTPTERLMLESLKLADKPVPDWAQAMAEVSRP